VIHSVLEKLFDLPAPGRTVTAAAEMVEPEWTAALAGDAELAALVDGDAAGLVGLLESTRELLASYFTLEDPRRLEPAEREVLVETTLPNGIRLKGFIDRLDRSPAGDLRVVDYNQARPRTRPKKARRCSSCGSTRSCCGVDRGPPAAAPALLPVATARSSTTPPTSAT